MILPDKGERRSAPWALCYSCLWPEDGGDPGPLPGYGAHIWPSPPILSSMWAVIKWEQLESCHEWQKAFARCEQWMEGLAASMTADARYLEALFGIMRDMDEGQGCIKSLLGAGLV